VAPGPLEPEPVLDAGPPLPQPDAGPRDAGPPPDAGADCTVEYRDLTPEEDLQVFSDLQVASFFSCASCHRVASAEPTNRGQQWGTNSNDLPGWYEACATLAESDAALPIASNGLYRAFLGPAAGGFSASHPANVSGAAAMDAWLRERREGIGEVVCQDAGPPPSPVCEPTSRLVTEAEAKAELQALNIVADFSCALCHRSGSAPSGRGQSWGPGANPGTPEQWSEAIYNLAQRESGVAIADTGLVKAFSGVWASHPNESGKRGRMETWLGYLRTPIEDSSACD
jgi:hypothetical protein